MIELQQRRVINAVESFHCGPGALADQGAQQVNVWFRRQHREADLHVALRRILDDRGQTREITQRAAEVCLVQIQKHTKDLLQWLLGTSKP